MSLLIDCRAFALPHFLDKIVAKGALTLRLAAMARPLVFTNGVFDLLHPGHITYLHDARQLGANLIVALNTDASARRLGKGVDRPLNNQQDRAFMVAALACVSLVTWFDEDTPLALVNEIKPDILVKGGDYNMAILPETAAIQSWGGRALAMPFVNGYSTTALVRKIRDTDSIE